MTNTPLFAVQVVPLIREPEPDKGAVDEQKPKFRVIACGDAARIAERLSNHMLRPKIGICSHRSCSKISFRTAVMKCCVPTRAGLACAARFRRNKTEICVLHVGGLQEGPGMDHQQLVQLAVDLSAFGVALAGCVLMAWANAAHKRPNRPEDEGRLPDRDRPRYPRDV
jgi:hypothetical protein